MADTYLKQIQDAQKSKLKDVHEDIDVIRQALENSDPAHNRWYRIVIQTPSQIFEPVVKDEITLEWERAGVPGKLTFTVIKDPSGMSFHEGDRVVFFASDRKTYNNLSAGTTPYSIMFVGYVFKKSRDKKHHIEVTCYDQLRYLKNKYSWSFVNKTASQILTSICKDYGLYYANIADTKYAIPALAMENAEAFDVILTALQETLAHTGKMYILSDNNGTITLVDAESYYKRGYLVCDETAQNFEYTSDIDTETYNSVVLYYKPNTTTTT